jgi:hypothetical protein
MERLLHPSVLDKRFSSRSLDVMIFSVPVILPTQITTNLCVANLQAKQEINDL